MIKDSGQDAGTDCELRRPLVWRGCFKRNGTMIDLTPWLYMALDPMALFKGQHLVACPIQMAIKAALYLAIRESGISKRELGWRLGVDEKSAAGCSIRTIRRVCPPWNAPCGLWARRRN